MKHLTQAEVEAEYLAMRNNPISTPQSDGLAFESLIFSLLKNHNLEPRVSFRPEGEQIDGSFIWNGNTVLIEAKWTKKPLAASEIYAFKGKVDGKFHTTSGIFLSLSGYSPKAEDTVKSGKDLNVILFDGDDIDLLFTGQVEFGVMLKYKLRQAGDTGTILAPYKLAEQAHAIEDVDTEEIEYTAPDEYDEAGAARLDDILVFVEGDSDVQLIRTLLEAFQMQLTLTYKIVPLGGAFNIRRLPSLVSDYIGKKRLNAVMVFLDDDQETKSTKKLIDDIVESMRKSSISVQSRFFFVSKPVRQQLLKGVMRFEQLEQHVLFKEAMEFLQRVAQEHYNQENEIFLFTMEALLREITFDAEMEDVFSWDEETGMTSRIESLRDLIDDLDSAVIDAMEAGMPEWWVMKESPLGYAGEIREYLSEHFADEIRSVGWNPEEF